LTITSTGVWTRGASAAGVLLAGWILAALPVPARAHCDSLDGPVVKAARAALDEQNVSVALRWVAAEHEAELRDAFRRTIEVRGQTPEARALADRWFYETLVRLHREGEGAPYTGLKPGGWQPPALVAAADHAIDDGEVDALAARVGEHVSREIRARHARAKALEPRNPSDVEGGRRYVAAYIEFVHLLEGLHHQLHGGGGHDH
jgi:hypothetical protein